MTSTPDSPLDVDAILAGLTLEEKAALTTGADFWQTVAVDRLGLPAIAVSDGPHGVRKQNPGSEGAFLRDSFPATCFPTAAALGSSWDLDLLQRVGSALGVEARHFGLAVLLGPGVNIKRHPLCGRNFEYFSEDPVLAGDLAAAFIEGVQSQGVGTSLKHFAANNQETDRMRVSAEIDERTLREIYLRPFERAVTKAKPWTLMCSYNRINGVYSSQNRWLLTDVLRDEWGFEGLVMSDWGATQDRVAAVGAGLDLTMPAQTVTDADLVAAVRAGTLPEVDLDNSVRRVLQLVARSLPGAAPDSGFDATAHHALAREAAAAGSVLLQNSGAVLPLSPGDLADAVVVGEFARTPRYQGDGSSRVNPTQLDTALDALRAAAGTELAFAPGFTITGGPEGDDDVLRAEALEAAAGAGTVLAFLGLPGPDESEGYDRPRMELPENQVALLDALAAAGARVVVVLANGAAVAMPWADRAAAILEVWLGGQAGGSAVADVLTGAAEPGGRLTETIPVRLEDTPSFGNFPGEFSQVRYAEGLLVGYRGYDARGIAPAFPFGYGLGYTTFDYDDVSASVRGSGASVEVDVSVRVTNSGSRAGTEVVQVYVADVETSVQRAPRELRAFAKVRLEPGASDVVSVTLSARDLAFWYPPQGRWAVESGVFEISVGASSRDLRGTVAVEVEGEPVYGAIDLMSTFGELWQHPAGRAVVEELIAAGRIQEETVRNEWAVNTPIRVAAGLGLEEFGPAHAEQLLAAVHARSAELGL